MADTQMQQDFGELCTDVPMRRFDFHKQQQMAVREFIADVNVMDDNLTEADYVELESGKYKLRLGRELDL